MQKTILIAEDFNDPRYLMKLILESYEYRVVEAADGIQAVEMFKLYSPDLVLMDLAMPQMDGLTATEIIRSLERSTKIPIIAVTAYGEHFYDKAIEAGCSDLIEKPVDFDTLISLLNRYFNR